MNKEDNEVLQKIDEFADWFDENRDYNELVDAIMRMATTSGLIEMDESGKKSHEWKYSFEENNISIKVSRL